jgi:hypothetical protein
VVLGSQYASVRSTGAKTEVLKVVEDTHFVWCNSGLLSNHITHVVDFACRFFDQTSRCPSFLVHINFALR